MKLLRTVLIVLAPALMLTGCFTGVESTPRITYKDVKNNHAVDTTPEQLFARELVPQSFAQWRQGKRFYVTSSRISLVLTSVTPGEPMPAEADTLVLGATRYVPDLTGRQVVELTLTPTSAPGHQFVYRTNATEEELTARETVEIPFTIDLDFVSDVKEKLVGRELFVRTPLWFNLNEESASGRKFVKVKITDVRAANEVYPFCVVFTDDRGESHGLFMSGAGTGRWTTRGFPALFSMSDMRLNYPHISDGIWHHIVNTRVAEGMTKEEATLAIGTPESIDRGYNQSSVYERWNYPDGRYLIFEDGLLVRFNR